MEIQNGQASYKGNLYNVRYFSIEDVQYFVIEQLSNGNYIANTNLKEAINEEMNPVSYGVISNEGNVVIPFDKRSVKSLFDKYLIAELSKPTSQAVIEMDALKNDPLAASKLVTIRAEFKENINSKMTNGEGRFIHNDPGSEVKIYDYDGKDLASNDTIVSVASDETGLYLETIDKAVKKLDFATNTIVDLDQQEIAPATNTESADATQIPTVEEPKEETPVAEETQPEGRQVDTVAPEQNVEVSAPVPEAQAPVTDQTGFAGPEANVPGQEVEIPTTEAPVTEEVQTEVAVPEATVPEQSTEVPAVETPVAEETQPEGGQVEAVAPVEEPQEQLADDSMVDTETVVSELNEGIKNIEPETSDNSLDVSAVEVDKNEIEKEIEDSDQEELTDTTNLDIEVDKEDSEVKDSVDDEFAVSIDDYDVEIPKTSHVEDKEDDYDYHVAKHDRYSYDSYEETSVIPSAIKTIDSLYKQNKDQKEHIEQLDEKNEVLKGKIISANEIIEDLKDRIKDLETDKHELQKTNDKLKSENKEKDNKIVYLHEERAKDKEKFKENVSDLSRLLRKVNEEEDNKVYQYVA